MTCHEFQEFARTRSILTTSYPERAALNRHYDGCPACQQFIADAGRLRDGARARKIDALADADLAREHK